MLNIIIIRHHNMFINKAVQRTAISLTADFLSNTCDHYLAQSEQV